VRHKVDTVQELLDQLSKVDRNAPLYVETEIESDGRRLPGYIDRIDRVTNEEAEVDGAIMLVIHTLNPDR